MGKTTKTFTYIIGIVMTVAMVGSLILPMISSQVGVGESYLETPQPTPFPEPTMPPPPNTAAIDFRQPLSASLRALYHRRANRLDPGYGQQQRR